MVFWSTFPEGRPRGHGGRERSAPQGALMLSPSRRLRILLVLLLTLTVLVSPGAWARGGPASRNEQPAKVSQLFSPSLLGRAWTLLSGLWAKEGCGIDPDGHCVTAPAS